MTAPPSVNIVIPTYGRPEQLQRTLSALARQSERSFTVTVVDDASPQPAEASISAQLREEPWLTFIRLDANHGPARARNLGVAATESPLVAFIDDDVVPDPEWLGTLLRHVDADDPRAVAFGPLLAPPDWKPTPWNRWEADTLARQYERMARGEYAPTWRQFFTGNALLSRRDFDAAGGFNESFTRAEDIELAYRLFRLGCHFRFVPNAVGWHYAERSKAAWMTLPRKYARFDKAMDTLYPELHWLGILERERRRQSLALRLGRACLRGAARNAAIRAAVDGARLAHAARMPTISTRLLSGAYGLAYHDELENGSAAALPPVAPTRRHGQPVNTESTPPQ